MLITTKMKNGLESKNESVKHCVKNKEIVSKISENVSPHLRTPESTGRLKHISTETLC